MSEDQFLAWAECRNGRFELIEGAVVMHAGATRDHERVAKRIFIALHAQADETSFDVNKGDFGVRIQGRQRSGHCPIP
ncbi:MAG: Uma2 family endonuclease [Methylobacterium frigidaeris]